MARQFDKLSEQHLKFINAQKMFFVATAAPGTKINLSPKGLDTFRIVDNKTVIWMNVTGSGNETGAHISEHPQMTIMFCSFDKNPLIMRLYGKARSIYRNDDDWDNLRAQFGDIAGARQIFEVKLDMVQTSCGFGVPLYEYIGDRGMMDKWARDKGENEIENYWKEKNMTSIDGRPTGMKV